MIEVRMPEEEREGTEASVAAWLKRPGDAVAEHEPLLEISTDKVTLEIAAPAKGMLVECVKAAGDTVAPGELLGYLRAANADDAAVATIEIPSPSEAAPPSRIAPPYQENTYSPAVRRLLRHYGLDGASIPKTTRGGRLTPADIEAYLVMGGRAAAHADEFAGRRVPHTPMRRSIANHMTLSVQTAPHVTAVFEADLSQVLFDRARRQRVPATAGGQAEVPSVTAYLLRAALEAIAQVPEVNSKWHDGYLEVFDHIHFGVGTALDTGGLVVPVLRHAQTMNLMQLSQNLKAMTAKARSGRLTQDDMNHGTFTLSNHGVSGSLLAAPIILPHGQAAILGAGKMQRRVVVCETGGRELFRIRPMMYVTLTVDHRALDGQQTNGFLSAFVAALERPLPPLVASA